MILKYYIIRKNGIAYVVNAKFLCKLKIYKVTRIKVLHKLSYTSKDSLPPLRRVNKFVHCLNYIISYDKKIAIPLNGSFSFSKVKYAAPPKVCSLDLVSSCI